MQFSKRLNRECPPFSGSATAKKTFFILAFTMAPAHIGQGSKVTYKSQSSSRQDFNFLQAFSIAKISA